MTATGTVAADPAGTGTAKRHVLRGKSRKAANRPMARTLSVRASGYCLVAPGAMITSSLATKSAPRVAASALSRRKNSALSNAAVEPSW